MSKRHVYLGHVDIGADAKLDLSRNGSEPTNDDLLQYLFRYGLVADQVLMQGSAPLKSRQVLSSYLHLLDAFKRNEEHEPTPIFAFALSEEAESYTDYILDRLHKLRGEDANNAEKIAYSENQALSAANKLDADLSVIEVPRRKHSVGQALRRGLLALLRSNDPKISGISDETSERAIEKIQLSEQIQTFKLLTSLSLQEKEQTNSLYRATRNRYREANAYGVGAINSDESPVWSPFHISRFLDAIGLQPWLSKTENLSSELLFTIRHFDSFRLLREEYFKSQSEDAVIELTTMLKNLRIHGKVLSSIRQSPAALMALVFEGLNDAKIGYKSINKAAELITKTVLSDIADEQFAKRCYRLHELVEMLKRDACSIRL
jgi:hypothetical protein